MLFGSSKVMGFRQPGIMTPYNFLMAAGISHIAASRMVSPKARLVDAIAIIIVYTLINLYISYLYFKAPSIVSQKPIMLAKNGKLIKNNISKSKLTIDNIFSILRQKYAINLEKADYLIAESTGDFSVGKNQNSLPIIKIDMGLKTTREILPQIIIHNYFSQSSHIILYQLSFTYTKHSLKK